MMITIHGFPAKTKYADVKILIKQECKLEDFMLGNMLPDTDGTKKVKIGLTDDNEGYLVMKCLDGYRMGGNFVLKTIPVGKSAPNPPPQNTFDSRPTFSANPQRSDYPNPSRNDYQSRGDYQGPPSNSYGNRAPGPHGSGGPAHGTSAPHHGPQSSMNAGRQAQWTPNNTGPWANNPPIATQTQQNYNYQSQQNIAPFGQQPHPTHNQRPGPDIRPFPQSRPNQEPGFGFQPKTNTVPDHGPSRQLRNIETVETSGNHPPIHGRYPQPSQQYQQNKPVTIMKENFQGPTSFNINHPGGSGPHYQEPGPQPWQHQGQQPKPQHFSKPSPITYEKPPYEDRKYPPTDREMPTTHKRPETYKEYEKIGRGYSPGRPHALRSSPIERRVSPSGRRMSPPVRRVSPSGRRMSPSGRRVSPSGRRVSPPGRRVSPSGRRISPPGRRISPSGRRISPPGRRVSPPGRRISPSGRRISPSGRRDSPSGRRLSPSGRLISPSVRHMGVRRESPTQKRPSPGRRPASPHRRPSPSRRESPTRHMRYSPGRHNPDKPIDKYGHDGKPKQVRPAYEPSSQASKQAIYSGGYRPNVHDNVQYPVPGSRQVEPHRSPWQRDRDEYINNPEEERRGTPRAEIPRDRNPDKIVEASRQPPVRKSRSPVRRERSPVRDRFKRHSPSPRSPRRSWAFEKRRSPDMSEAPPPPVWPGQKREEGRPDPEYRYSRPNFPDREQIEPPLHRSTFQKAEVHVPKWERAVDEERSRRPEDEERRFHKSSRDMEREPHLSHSERYPREPKFSPREEFDVERRVDYRRPNEQPTKAYIHREEPRRREEDRRHVEERRREESPRREIRDKLLKTDTIDKDFEDIYNRALQFKQKAEELRRSANRRSDSEEVRSHRGEREREKDRYERSYREEQPPRQDYRRDDYKEQHKSEEDSRPKRFTLSPSLKAKREKAIEDITSKIMQRHPDFDQLKGEQRQRMITELNLAVARIVFDMFGHQDVSFIEIVVKYQAKYSIKDEEKILQDVVSSLPSQFRHIKRHASDSCDVPAKMSRPSSSPGIKQETPAPSKFIQPPTWTGIEPPKLVTPMPILRVPPLAPVVNPMMVPSPFAPFHEAQQNHIYIPVAADPVPQETFTDDYSVYLCKDDFGPFIEGQADLLKNYLVSQIMQVSETSQGWAPDVTIKGLQSLLRYEVQCNDFMSRAWLISLDFSEFTYFNVLVYTKEELWYERAAIWLPGHSRSRKIEPLEKLKLQNKKLEDVDIGKWKFVKKIVTAKGMRLYVDMPPSSARALDKHKMMLSYELQKVNVFLKAVAVDKDAFDAGMREIPITNPAEIAAAVQNTPIPSLTYDPTVVKITLKGAKTLTLVQARKIKEVIIYQIFKYHQEDGICRTDFTKYGFMPPNYFGVVPENAESKRWLMARQFGKVNRLPISVLGDDDDNTCFFKMILTIPYEYQTNMQIVTERLKQSNQGVKGLNFNLWKPIKIHWDNKKPTFEVDIDLESLETLSKMDYQLDYVDQTSATKTVYFKSKYLTKSDLKNLIQKYKNEMTDIYDDTTMDLDSEASDNDVICLN